MPFSPLLFRPLFLDTVFAAPPFSLRRHFHFFRLSFSFIASFSIALALSYCCHFFIERQLFLPDFSPFSPPLIFLNRDYL